MLRDAKTTSIAERIHRPPLGGDTVPAAKGFVRFFLSDKITKKVTGSYLH
jgi:hypothetical protein